jgi:MFS family permease
VLVILALSLLGVGIGQTAITTLGIPYIDDNVKSKQSPLYMAITIGVRVLGPALGYYLGAWCIRRYVDLSMVVDHTDPNFIGAWWLGELQVLNILRRCVATKMCNTFRRSIKNAYKREEETKKPSRQSRELNSRQNIKKTIPSGILVLDFLRLPFYALKRSSKQTKIITKDALRVPFCRDKKPAQMCSRNRQTRSAV